MTESIFTPKPNPEPFSSQQVQATHYPEAYAGDKAWEAVYAQPDLDFEEARQEAATTGTVQTAAHDWLLEKQREGAVQGILTSGELSQMEPEDQRDLLIRQMETFDPSNLSSREELTYQLMKEDYYWAPASTIDEMHKDPSVDQGMHDARLSRSAAQQTAFVEELVMPAIESAEYENLAVWVGEGVKHELTPGLNVVSKMQMVNIFREESGLAATWNPLLGSTVKESVDAFMALPLEEQRRRIPRIVTRMQALQQDKIFDSYYGKYNINEQMEYSLGAVLRGGSSTSEVVWRNIEGILELTIVGGYAYKLLAKGGRAVRGITRVSRAAEENTLVRAAANNGNRAQQARLTRVLLDGAADALGLDKLEIAASTLPKAPLLEDVRHVQPPVGQPLATVDEIGETRRVKVSDTLSPESKRQAQKNFVEETGRAPGMSIWPAMTLIDELEDGTGFGTKVVMGKNDTEAYHSLDEIFADYQYMDPTGTNPNIKIMVRGPDNNIEELTEGMAEIRKILEDGPVSGLHDADLFKQLSEADPSSLHYGLLEREFNRRSTNITRGTAPKDNPSLNPFKDDTDLPDWEDAKKKPDYFREKKNTVVTTVRMTPDAYLENVADGFIAQGGTRATALDNAIDTKLVDKYAKDMEKGDKFPQLTLDYKDGFSQEGRHRAAAAKKAGVRDIPVAVRHAADESLPKGFRSGAAPASEKTPEQLGLFPKQELFIQSQDARRYHPMDNLALSPDTFRNSWLPDIFHVPSTRFGGRMVDDFWQSLAAGRHEEKLWINEQFDPYFKLKDKDKRVVDSMLTFEEKWYAKNNGAPTQLDFAAEMEVTSEQFKVWQKVREGYDAMHVRMNTRLYTELSGAGAKTIRHADDVSQPQFHGVPVPRSEQPSGHFLDPSSGEVVKLSKAEVDDLYANGGGVIRLDDAEEAVNGDKATRVIADGNDYELGRLSNTPLQYYKGYRFRFQENPYMIMRNRQGVKVDGVVKEGIDQTPSRTANSMLNGERYLNKHFTRTTVQVKGGERLAWVSKKDPDVFYTIENAADLSSTDKVFAQRQIFKQQGRVLWGKRERHIVPDTNESASPILDMNRALEQGTALYSKQMNMEDILRTYKIGMINEFSVLPELQGQRVAFKPSRQIVEDLKAGRRGATDPHMQGVYDSALKMAKYLRSLDNADDELVLGMRKWLLDRAQWADRMLGKGERKSRLGRVEKWAMNTDPLQAMRSSAFLTFIVTRPARMVMLQAMQPLMLAFKDPLYVLSGRGLMDSINIRHGLSRLNKTHYAHTTSAKVAAKAMGLKVKEYNRLIREIERSGILDLIDMQAVVEGANRTKKIALRAKPTYAQHAIDIAKRGGIGTFDVLKKGFDYGESMNKIGTIQIALRTTLKEKGYKSLLELTDDEWVTLFRQSENLSLAMNPTNKAFYQSGLLSLPFQFMSFTHKAGLMALGQNPALKGKKNLLGFWVGMATLYGADSVGAKDFIRESLRSAGLEDRLPEQAIDLIAGGSVETLFNQLATWTDEDWKKVDFGPMKPSLDYGQFVSMYYENLMKNPAVNWMGASGNVMSAVGRSSQFFYNTLMKPADLTAAQQFEAISRNTLVEIFPQMSNLTRAWMGQKYQRIYYNSGESLPIKTSFLNNLVKGAFGLPTEQELMLLQQRTNAMERDQIVDELVREARSYTKKHMMIAMDTNEWDALYRAGLMVAQMAEFAPDGRSQEVLERAMTTPWDNKDPESTIVALMGKYAVENRLSRKEVRDMLMTFAPDLTPEEREALEYILESVMPDKEMNSEEMRLLLEQKMRDKL